MARIRTTNKAQVYNTMKKQYYANINDIMKKQYQKYAKARNVLREQQEQPSFFDQLFAIPNALVSGYYDILGGAYGAFGNVASALINTAADFLENAYNVLDGEGDWEEDLAYTISSLPADLIKGVGTAGVGFVAGVKKFFGDETAMEDASKTTKQIEDWVNVNVIGESIQSLSGSMRDKKERFDNAEYIQQYIDSKYDPNSFSSVVKGATAVGNQWYQRNIVDPIKKVNDERLKGTFVQPLYKQIIEPVATNIGELVPAIALGATGNPVAAKAFFASNVYGRSYQEAIERGATDSDAKVYALGLALSELTLEQIGGFTLGKALPTNMFSSILSEGVEEFAAELIQPGMEALLTKDRDPSTITPGELQSRAFYAALLGGVSGGVFAGVGNISSEVTSNPREQLQALQEEFSKKGRQNTRRISKQIKKLQDKLNTGRMDETSKQEILDNPLYKLLFKDVEGQVELTPIGQRMSEGKIIAQQGDVAIDKKTFVVGSDEFLVDIDQTLKIEGQEYNIEIVKNEELKNESKEVQEEIKFLRDNNVRFALMKTDANVDGYSNPNTGMIYVNLNRTTDAGIIDVMAHEINDTIFELGRKGKLSESAFKAYQTFFDAIQGDEFNNIVNGLGWNKVRQNYVDEFKDKMKPQDFEAMLAREKTSFFIAKVLKNEAIFKQALVKNPSILRSIANIFVKPQLIKSEFTGNKEVLNKLLKPAQENFARLLKEGREFIYSPTTIEGTLVRKAILDPNLMFTIGVRDFNAIEIKDEKDLKEKLENKEVVLKELVGYNENYQPKEIPESSRDVEADKNYNYLKRNKPEYIDKTREQKDYIEQYGKEYFLKIGDKFYDKSKFVIPEGAEIDGLQFIDNNFFRITFTYIPTTNNFESGDFEMLEDMEQFRQVKIYPDIIKDGKVIERPIMVVSSMNPARIDFALENKGILPNQSMALHSATAMTLGTQEFEGIFTDGDHNFTLTFVYKKDVVESNGFLAFKDDIQSPIPIFEKNETDVFGEPITASNELQIKRDVNGSEYGYESIPFKNKMKTLVKTLNIIKEQAIDRVNYTKDENFFSNQSNENIKRRLSDIMRMFDILSKTRSTKVRIKYLKEQMNRQLKSPEQLIKLARTVTADVYRLFNSELSILEIGQLLDIQMNSKRGLTYNPNNELYFLRDKYANELERISDFMDTYEFPLERISEANHPKANVNQVGAAIFTHFGENKNSSKYKDIVKMLQKNNVAIVDNVNALTLEQLKEEAGYNKGGPYENSFFFSSSVWHNRHIDSGKQSIIDSAREVDNADLTDLMFSLPPKDTTQTKAVDNQELETQPIVDEAAEQTQEEFEKIEGTQTPTTENETTKNERIIEAQQISREQNKQTYKQLNKDFARFLRTTFTELENLKSPEIKNLLTLYKKYESVIRKDARANQYVNHLTTGALKAYIMEVGRIYRTRFSKGKAPSQFSLSQNDILNIAKKVNEAIFSTMSYLSEVTSKRYMSRRNETGMIYAKYSHWFLRDFMEADLSNAKTLELFTQKDTRGNFYRRLMNAIYNMTNKNGMKELMGAFEGFFIASDINRVNDLSLQENDTQRTTKEVKRQWFNNSRRIDTIVNGTNFNRTIPKLYEQLVDPYSFLMTQGLFNEQSWAAVVYKKMVEAQENMIEVDRVFEEIIQSEQWLKENYREIKRIENKKQAIEVSSLGGAKLTLSQVIFLRDMVAREVLRNRAIDLEIIEGEKSEHFKDGARIDILELTDDNQRKIDNRQKATMTTSLELVNELDALIEQNNVAKQYNQKVLDFMSRLYPLINERFVEINGQPLQNEGVEIKQSLDTLDDSQIEELFQGLPQTINQENVDKIYVPIYVGESGYFNEQTVSMQDIIDLGVFDGMTQSIKEGSDGIVKVDSITRVLYKYKQEARNYYGLHRLMNDWNRTVNERLEGQQFNLREFITKQAIDYTEKLLKDMAGYSRGASGYYTQKSLAWLRKNFYRAALAGNLKVIFTQLTTVYNLSMLYGDNPFTFFPKMYKNLFMQLSPKNRQKLQDMKDSNNIYYDRSYQPTFDIAEAQTQGIDGNSAFNRIVNLMMSGISITDNAINKAFYLTLLETTNPKTNSLYTEKQANEVLNQGIIRSQSSALDVSKAPILRTDSDLLKLMIKFMGEPLKLQSQIYAGAKKLDLIRKLKNNEASIKEQITIREDAELQRLERERKELKELQQQEQSEDFATLENEQQDEIRKNIKEQQKVVDEAEVVFEEIKEDVENIKEQIDLTIASQPEAKQQIVRRIATIIGAMTYMASLGIAWNLLLKDMGKLDDREEDEELANYIARKFGTAMGAEAAGLFPIIRDIYGLVVEGYDLDTIDELGAITRTYDVMDNLYKDIVEGKQINIAKYARDLAVYGGAVFGIPVRNLEKILIAGMMISGNKDDYYRYRFVTGQRISSNKELVQAINEGNDELVQEIVNAKIQSRSVSVSQPVMDEITRLFRVGENPSMTSVLDSYTIDGVEYQLETKDKTRFKQIYNQADFVVQKIITSSAYRRLNDKKKASLIKSIYNYFLKVAQEEVFGVSLLPRGRGFRTLNQTFFYFRDEVAPSLLTRQRNEIRESRRQR